MGTNKAALLAAAAAMVLVYASGPVATAETIVVNGQVTLVKSAIPRPRRGMTMKTVVARFGAPSERHPTVGKPPITRWDYQQFAVFFEKNRVIHTVVTGPDEPAVATAPVNAAAPASAPAPTAPAKSVVTPPAA